jgi:hypothetical protein
MYTNIQQDATIISWFYFKISTCFGYLLYPSVGVQYCSWQSLVCWIVKCMVTSTLKVVQNQAVGHITVVELEMVPVPTQLQWCDQPPDSRQPLKWTLPYISRSNVIYVIPVTVNCSIVLLMMVQQVPETCRDLVIKPRYYRCILLNIRIHI